MEGHILSRRPAGQADAPLLRGALSLRRDQQHLLSHAQGFAFAFMGSGSAGGFQIRAESPSTDYAYAASQRRGGLCLVFSEGSICAQGTPWSAVVPIAALYEERRGAPAGIPGVAAGGPTRGFRISAPIMDR